MEDVAVQTLEQGTLVVATRAPTPYGTSKPAAVIRARHQLQLPSFHALGIGNPFPINMLTPPDEPTSMNWTPPMRDQSDFTSMPLDSIPYGTPASNRPQTPILSSAAHTASHDAATQSAGNALVTFSVPSLQSHHSSSSESSSATEIASNMPWLEGTIGVILPQVPSGDNISSVVTMLSHPQPCPLSQNVLGAPSAATGIINALQTRFGQDSSSRYIDVTHAVPAKFNLSQLPNSPMTTPNRPAAEGSMDDYFSIPQTIVYSKGTIATSHAEARQNLAGNPGSKAFPQTIVAPLSISISVLERFIPPATVAEYDDLFKFDQPSALVDRMLELKPDNGHLVFVYPTQKGADTFRDDYLGPILDPLLRTMIGVHGISTNVMANIAYLEPIWAMHNFHQLQVKVAQLLSSMNRKAGGNLHRFAIAQASSESVHVGREAWASWFTEQELPRMRDIMTKSYGRTSLQPQNEGVGDYTAAGLVREIIDGIKGRPYEAGEAPRQGIEVGVFVIRRVR
ncbi:MAG: hypothetical protein Q9207_007627 [Kuettlingeria erythrocarpa]